MPDHDDCRDFCMGWGNHQPLIEFGALWENVQHRLERSNGISGVHDLSMTYFLKTLKWKRSSALCKISGVL